MLVDVLAEADEPEHLLDAPPHFVERHVALLVELVADVLGHGQRVEERAFLEHHPEVGADLHQLVFAHSVDLLAVDPDDAAVRLQQTEDQLQDRRLPRPAGAQEDLGVPGDQREADVAQDHLVVEGQRHAVEDHDRRSGPEGLGESG